MTEKSSKDRRKHIRIPLISEACIWTEYVDAYELDRKANLKDITIAGIFIKSDYLPKISSIIMIKFQLPGDLGTLVIKGKVVRLRWIETKKISEPKGFGVEFLQPSSATFKILDAYVVYLRNKQIIEVSKRIIREFFANKELPNNEIP